MVTNCLINKKLVVRYIMHKDPDIQDENHVLYGGLANDATIEYVAPINSAGFIVSNIATAAEQEYLEECLGLPKGSMSPNILNNFWNDYTRRGLNSVVLSKEDTILDLSKPYDYIKWLILKANKDEICISHEEYTLRPKPSYRFELIDFAEQDKINTDMMNIEIQAYEIMGSIKSDYWKLKTLLEIITNKIYASSSSLNYFQSEIHKLIKRDIYLFVDKANDPLLDYKILINKAVDKHIIIRRNSTYYYEGQPMCDSGQESTLNIAAHWLSLPKNSDIKYAVEGKLQEGESTKSKTNKTK